MDDSFCTERNGAPVTDIIVAGALPLFGFIKLATPGDSTGMSETEAAVVSSSLLLVSGVELASAIWGFHTTRRCREYSARLLRAESEAPAR